MKNLTTYTILLFIVIISCSRNSIEGLVEEEVIAIEEPENTATTPCDFNLSNVKEGETITMIVS